MDDTIIAQTRCERITVARLIARPRRGRRAEKRGPSSGNDGVRAYFVDSGGRQRLRNLGEGAAMGTAGLWTGVRASVP
ncbi:MAG: hypothetical protein K8J09_12405 [Planctomycetes bacterium]|nr:hypothetical protein [Planctomycetota bacterium]